MSRQRASTALVLLLAASLTLADADGDAEATPNQSTDTVIATDANATANPSTGTATDTDATTGRKSVVIAPMPYASLEPFTATYEVRLNNLPFRAKATQTLKALDKNRYRLELRVESFLLDTTEVSEFSWDGVSCHASPGHYSYERRGIGRNRQLDLRFNHATGQVTRDDGKETGSYAFNRKTEDKLGHTMSLACRVARGARDALTLPVAWDRDVRQLDYAINPAPETITTPHGTHQTLMLTRVRSGSDRVTKTWLAPTLGWHGAQMQHTEGDGRYFTLRLVSLEKN